MAVTIVGQISIGGMAILNIVGDPRVSPGLPSDLGSLAVDGTTDRIYLKQSIVDTDWGVVGAKNYIPQITSRTLNSAAYQIDAVNPTWVFYTVAINCSSLLGSSQTGSVTLVSDSSSAPSTNRCQVANSTSVSLVGLTAVNNQTMTLSYLVPPGHYVKLVSTGNATISLTMQTEVSIAA